MKKKKIFRVKESAAYIQHLREEADAAEAAWKAARVELEAAKAVCRATNADRYTPEFQAMVELEFIRNKAGQKADETRMALWRAETGQ